MVISWQIHREKKVTIPPQSGIKTWKFWAPNTWTHPCSDSHLCSCTHHFTIQCLLCQFAEDRFWRYSGWVISSFHCCQDREEKIHTSLPSTDLCEDHFLSPSTSTPILRALLCRFFLVKRKKTSEEYPFSIALMCLHGQMGTDMSNPIYPVFSALKSSARWAVGAQCLQDNTSTSCFPGLCASPLHVVWLPIWKPQM